MLRCFTGLLIKGLLRLWSTLSLRALIRTSRHPMKDSNIKYTIYWFLMIFNDFFWFIFHFRTPLHWAAISGRINTFHTLCKEGADITITDARGYNVLHHAVQYGKIYPAFYALNKGIDVNSRGKSINKIDFIEQVLNIHFFF